MLDRVLTQRDDYPHSGYEQEGSVCRVEGDYICWA